MASMLANKQKEAKCQRAKNYATETHLMSHSLRQRSPSQTSQDSMFIYLKRTKSVTANRAEVMTLCRAIFWLAMGLIALVMVGLMGHYYGYQKIPSDQGVEYDDWIREELFKAFDANKIRLNLRNLTAKAHIAGSPNNLQVAKTIAARWREVGLQGVHLAEYTVLLSRPDSAQANIAELIDEEGNVRLETAAKSPEVIEGEQGDPMAQMHWNAYSGNGTVMTQMVYCNYGRPQDFDYLADRSISVLDRIAIMRYGKGFRGDKVAEAQRRGALGAILFSDPSQYATEGTKSSSVYPNTIWMPGDAVQRGSVMRYKGDVLSPLYPAKNYTYQTQTVSDAMREALLPTIPVLPISYKDAHKLLSELDGKTAPEQWQGSLNFTYKLGPMFKGGDKYAVRLTVHSKLEKKTVQNVIGYINGIHEPHKYVLLGNHYDAWGYGSVDPNSGTAVQLELARVIMDVSKRTEWKPSRTIVFCAWDAEEFGLIGSTEWLEEHSQILSDRAIVYLNVDNINGNQTLFVRAVPSIHPVVLDAATAVQDPQGGTLYDNWLTNLSEDKKVPYIGMVQGGSDHLQFVQYLGIAAADIRYTNKHPSGHPLYHTLYETVFLNEQLMHPHGFDVHVAVGRYWLELVRRFSDYSPLPFSTSSYAWALRKYITRAKADIESIIDSDEQSDPINQIDLLLDAINRLEKKTYEFHNATNRLQPSAVYEQPLLAAANDRMTKVERCFINPRGLPGQPEIRHTILGLNPDNSYRGQSCPGIYEALNRYKSGVDKKRRKRAVRRLCEQISIVQYGVECAIMPRFVCMDAWRSQIVAGIGLKAVQFLLRTVKSGSQASIVAKSRLKRANDVQVQESMLGADLLEVREKRGRNTRPRCQGPRAPFELCQIHHRIDLNAPIDLAQSTVFAASFDLPSAK